MSQGEIKKSYVGHDLKENIATLRISKPLFSSPAKLGF
jgi:hypothetical protein